MRASYADDKPRNEASLHTMAARFGVKLGEGWTKELAEVDEVRIDNDAYQSFLFFMRYADQWRYSAHGTLLGLDVLAMVAVIKLEVKGRKKRKRLLDDVVAAAKGLKEGIDERDDD